MEFKVVWVYDSKNYLYLEKIQFVFDGTELYWVKDNERAILFDTSESPIIQKIMDMYFEGNYYIEYFGGNEK